MNVVAVHVQILQATPLVVLRRNHSMDGIVEGHAVERESHGMIASRRTIISQIDNQLPRRVLGRQRATDGVVVHHAARMARQPDESQEKDRDGGARSLTIT